MKITVVTGSRADYGGLEWLIKTLREDSYFHVEILNLWNHSHSKAFDRGFNMERPDLLMALGDRFEILGSVIAAHLRRIPVAHIAGGDVTEGSYDDAMRDCISRMASIHFATSTSAMARLTAMGLKNIHLTGSPGIDYIKHADWKRDRPMPEPYVVVSYQAETIDSTNEIDWLLQNLPAKNAVFILPNRDAGNEAITEAILNFVQNAPGRLAFDCLEHGVFLNYLAHCDEFIGNSSAMLYEAPELGIKTRMIGKRQKGRTIPWGDGNASMRIAHILKYGTL